MALPEDLEVPATFRNLDLSLRVILNETRVLRETMEDVEREMGCLQGQLDDIRRSLHDRSGETSVARPPRRENTPLGEGSDSSLDLEEERPPGVRSPSPGDRRQLMSCAACEPGLERSSANGDRPDRTRFPLGLATRWGVCGEGTT